MSENGARTAGACEVTGRGPHPALVRYVGPYQAYSYSAPGPVWRREPPNGAVTVIVNLGWGFEAGWVGEGGARHTVAPVSSFVVGVQDRAAFTLDGGGQRGIEFSLTPMGALALFGVPARELTGRLVPLEETLGPTCRGLVERLADTPGWARRFDLLDTALLRRLDRPVPSHPMVAEAWEMIASSPERMRVDELCRAVGRSRRHLTAAFHEQVGLPPKVMARVLRLDRAVRLVRRPGPVPLADIASRCGFYDQAHLNREFAALVGCTPGELRAEFADDVMGAEFVAHAGRVEGGAVAGGAGPPGGPRGLVTSVQVRAPRSA